MFMLLHSKTQYTQTFKEPFYLNKQHASNRSHCSQTDSYGHFTSQQRHSKHKQMLQLDRNEISSNYKPPILYTHVMSRMLMKNILFFFSKSKATCSRVI